MGNFWIFPLSFGSVKALGGVVSLSVVVFPSVKSCVVSEYNSITKNKANKTKVTAAHMTIDMKPPEYGKELRPLLKPMGRQMTRTR